MGLETVGAYYNIKDKWWKTPKADLKPVQEAQAVPTIDEGQMDEEQKAIRRRSGLERTYVTGGLYPKSPKNTTFGAV